MLYFHNTGISPEWSILNIEVFLFHLKNGITLAENIPPNSDFDY